jgi:hypothetical protein
LTTDELLAELGIDLATRVRVYRLIAGHERRPAGGGTVDRFPAERAGPGPELALLDDADALSFFSLDSGACLADLGVEPTARRVTEALARLRPASRAWLQGLRLRAAIAQMIHARESDPARRLRLERVRRSAAPAPAGPARGSKPSRFVAMARSRLAAGMAGGAGIARTRTSALLARAAAIGALAARPAPKGP